MNPLSCREVEENIELFAAGECDRPLAEQIERHVAECAGCAALWREARQLLGLLDLRFQEADRLHRLRERLSVEDARSRKRVRLLRIAVAAAVLLGVGLGAWLLPRWWASDSIVPVVTGPIELAGVAVVWASPDAEWKALAPRRLELTRGELWLRTVGAEQRVSLEVVTPFAVATAHGTEFTIDVRPAQTLAGAKGGPPMRWKALVYVGVLSGVVQLSNPFGTVSGSRGAALAAEEKEAPQKQVEALAQRFGCYYQPIKVNAQARIPAYVLPLDVEKVANFQHAAGALGLKADEASLKANGFVVLPGQGNEDIVAPYKDLFKREVPIFVTSDTLLHLYHIQFDETLREIEEREFYPDMLALTKALIAQLEAQPLPADTADFRAARSKALTYLAIGLKALDPKVSLPKGVAAQDVEIVLEKMAKHEGFWPQNPRTAAQEWPLFCYGEDFSQYLPRGHYTRSENLKRYFVGLMWYGRMTFLLKGHPRLENALVTLEEANRQTLAASLLTNLLDTAQLPDQRTARAVWERVYAVTAFYVGLADDLGLPEYQASLKKVCGAALTQLGGEQKLLELKADLARHQPPAIFSGTGQYTSISPSAGPEELVKALGQTQGFRLMGQRFVPDSHMLGKMVAPTVGDPMRAEMFTWGQTRLGGARVFPRGLDVMTVLGSQRARAITHELGDDAYAHGRGLNGGDALSYDEAIAALQKDYSKLSDTDWNRNLYWSWLHALKPLLTEHGQGYPTFMTTEAYRTKSLNTALASWAQLRHDTILYAKQSYTMTMRGGPPRQPKPVQGYVEPVPEFYARLLTLARMTSKGLGEMKVLDAAAAKRLNSFEKLLERLLAISEKELANEELKEDDYQFIRAFGTHLEAVVAAPSARAQQLPREIARAQEAKDFKRAAELRKELSAESNPAHKTTIVADVHTDQNSRKVLEEATGYVDLGVFVYVQPDGRLVVGAGPVLSYYEFKQPMADRLTDEKWRVVLKAGEVKPPSWTRSYLSEKGKYVCPDIYSQRVGGLLD